MQKFFHKIKFSELHPNVIGGFWMIGSVIGFLTSNLAVKFAGESLPSIQIVFIRCLFQCVILFPLLWWHGFSKMKTKQYKNYFFRLTFGVSNIIMMFYAYTHLKFATATSIVFSRPLFTIVLAAFLLNERVGWKRGIATVIGFMGILVVLHPGPMGLTVPEIVALGASFCLAAAYIFIQKLSRTEDHIAMMMWFAVAAVSVSCIPAIYVWQPFGLRTLGVILIVAIMATSGQYCIIRAYLVGKSTIISPLEYLQIPFSALIGFCFFSEKLSMDFAVGSLIIALTSIYILRKKSGD